MSKSSSSVSHPRLRRVYAREGDKHDLWDAWADGYDADLIGELGYVAHEQAGELFLNRVPDRCARVLDAGCGTGLGGAYLAAHGYHDVHGIDYSEPMLEVARGRGVYTSLEVHDLTRPLPPQTHYDAVLCVGVFAFFPPAVSDLRHLVAVLEPGRPAIVTVNGRGWVEKDWERLLDEEQRAGSFVIDSVHTIAYLTREGIDGRVLVLHREAPASGGV